MEHLFLPGVFTLSLACDWAPLRLSNICAFSDIQGTAMGLLITPDSLSCRKRKTIGVMPEG